MAWVPPGPTELGVPREVQGMNDLWAEVVGESPSPGFSVCYLKYLRFILKS